MNRDQADRFRDRHVRYQFDLLHLLPALPSEQAAAGLYLKKFYNSTKRHRLVLPSSITDSDATFCGNCGVVRVAGHNLQLRKQVHSDRASLHATCKNCQHQHTFDLGLCQSEEQPQPQQNTSAPASIQKNKSTAKARAKKRKQNSLTNLLAKKNQEKAQNSSNSSSRSSSLLSLDSFMQKK